MTSYKTRRDLTANHIVCLAGVEAQVRDARCTRDWNAEGVEHAIVAAAEAKLGTPEWLLAVQTLAMVSAEAVRAVEALAAKEEQVRQVRRVLGMEPLEGNVLDFTEDDVTIHSSVGFQEAIIAAQVARFVVHGRHNDIENCDRAFTAAVSAMKGVGRGHHCVTFYDLHDRPIFSRVLVIDVNGWPMWLTEGDSADLLTGNRMAAQNH